MAAPERASLVLSDTAASRSIARGSLSQRMQGFEKCDECSGLRRTQVLPIRRHVAAALDHLADELVLREPHGNTVQAGPRCPPASPSEWQLRHCLT